MPIDDTLINEKIEALRLKFEELNTKRIQIRETMGRLKSIQMVEVGQMVDDGQGGQKEEKTYHIPKDQATGAEMSVARRQEVYDAQMSVADNLLA